MASRSPGVSAINARNSEAALSGCPARCAYKDAAQRRASLRSDIDCAAPASFSYASAASACRPVQARSRASCAQANAAPGCDCAADRYSSIARRGSPTRHSASSAARPYASARGWPSGTVSAI